MLVAALRLVPMGSSNLLKLTSHQTFLMDGHKFTNRERIILVLSKTSWLPCACHGIKNIFIVKITAMHTLAFWCMRAPLILQFIYIMAPLILQFIYIVGLKISV